MNKGNKGKIKTIIENTYLEQLEEMDYPVIKHTVLSKEEFNEELIAAYCEAAPVHKQDNAYLEAIEAMGFPVIKHTVLSKEEFNELLRSGYLGDDTEDEGYQTLISKKLLDSRELAKVS